MDINLVIREPLLSILERDCAKSAEFLAEELRIEYPLEHQRVMHLYEEKYHLSVCGVHQSPLTAVNHVLHCLLAEGLVEQSVKNGIVLWRLLS